MHTSLQQPLQAGSSAKDNADQMGNKRPWTTSLLPNIKNSQYSFLFRQNAHVVLALRDGST